VALSHRVDKSVLTRLGEPSGREVVEDLVGNGHGARAGISDLEIGYSARNQDEWDELVDTLDANSSAE